MRPHILTLLLLSACLGRNSGKEVGAQLDTGELENEVDADGDGWPADEDCDDSNPNVNPGSPETCNNIDDDCDGETDEGVTTTFYADLDVDGYGDAEVTADTCDQPTGYVPTGTDCDDTRDDVYPNAPELCDGLDNGCDGDIDEEDTLSWYPDADADGFGDISADPTESCEGLSGYVLDNTDCDDDEAASFPDNPEVCDELDNDCDGLVDEGVTTTWYTDADADGYGDDLGQEEACSQPSGTAEVGGDCNESDSDINPGAAEICNGIDDDCDNDIDDDDSSLDTSTASTWYADDDTDGYGDAADTTTACDQPSGTVSDATDCDDDPLTGPSVNPGETEICNGTDDDCDTYTDNDDSDLDTSTATTWYADSDSDGYSDSATSQTTCDQPSGYIEASSSADCDDGCYSCREGTSGAGDNNRNGADDDCDGLIDEDSVAAGDIIITEVMVEPASGEVQWVELLNTSTSSDVALDGWYFEVGSDAVCFPVDAALSVTATDYLVLCAESGGAFSGCDYYWFDSPHEAFDGPGLGGTACDVANTSIDLEPPTPPNTLTVSVGFDDWNGTSSTSTEIDAIAYADTDCPYDEGVSMELSTNADSSTTDQLAPAY